MAMSFAFDNSYARLPERFGAPTHPAPAPEPRLLAVNEKLAGELGLDPAWLRSEEGLAVLSGNRVAAGAQPIALAYAGHQFGNFVPQLGDGRAVLLGEVVDKTGRRRDIALKGSGRTRFSRGGDGKAAIGPVLREYLVGEGMAALGIPTTRALAAVATGEPVYREMALPGAVLTRVAASHIRVGTFQYFAARQDTEALALLTTHALERHYPDAVGAANPALALLERVVAAQADLVARWLGVGFVHGVMNTDNTAISGETIDYGPCAFMEEYDLATVFSSIDVNGRYAYGNQPSIALWNLTRLAEALLPLIADDGEAAVALAQGVLDRFGDRFRDAYDDALARKLGLADEEGDAELIAGFLALMARHRTDFTLAFRRLADDEAALRALMQDDAELGEWLGRWRARLGLAAGEKAPAALCAANPLYIPRNHLVEEALVAATGGDLAPFERLLDVVSRPFEERPGLERYTLPATPDERVLRTFCGT